MHKVLCRGIGLVACIAAVSCVTPLPDNVPALVESRARDIVAVVEVISVRSYERTGGFGYPIAGEDGREYFHYASAPPFRVRARLISQLYGPALDREVSFRTHSHWGTTSFTNGRLKLVHLVTDGQIVVAPDEHHSDAGTDSSGMLIVPLTPTDTEWMPCGTDALKVPLSAKASTTFRTYYPSSDMNEEQEAYFWFEESRKSKHLLQKFPRYAIPVETLAAFLKEKQPHGEDFRCL